MALGQEGGGGGCLLRVEKKGPLARGKGANLWAPGSPFHTFLTPADLIVFHFCLLGNMPTFPQMVSGFRSYLITFVTSWLFGISEIKMPCLLSSLRGL